MGADLITINFMKDPRLQLACEDVLSEVSAPKCEIKTSVSSIST